MASPESDTGNGAPVVARDDAPGARRTRVGRIFRSVAPRYDLMNDLMSFGIHRLWRRAMIDSLRLAPGARVLDVAGGTGDVAMRLAGRAGSVTVCDAGPAMLVEGRRRAWDRGRVRGLAWACGDAEALPFARGTFDAATVAFGIRNVARIDAALGEIARVLAPGGRFVCLEFGPQVAPLLAPLYDAWSRHAIPTLGAVVAGDRAAYEYLVESIRRFPLPDAFSASIAQAGFAGVRARAFSGGIAWLHSGWRV